MNAYLFAAVGAYAAAGSFELGGSVAFVWTKEVDIVSVRPSLGYFVADRVELSILLDVEYARITNDDGRRAREITSALLFEPSYHLPIADAVYLFGGVGVGPGHLGRDSILVIGPRGGLNIELGSAAILSPVLRVPLLLRSSGGGDDESVDLSLGLLAELGITAAW